MKIESLICSYPPVILKSSLSDEPNAKFSSASSLEISSCLRIPISIALLKALNKIDSSDDYEESFAETKKILQQHVTSLGLDNFDIPPKLLESFASESLKSQTKSPKDLDINWEGIVLKLHQAVRNNEDFIQLIWELVKTETSSPAIVTNPIKNVPKDQTKGTSSETEKDGPSLLRSSGFIPITSQNEKVVVTSDLQSSTQPKQFADRRGSTPVNLARSFQNTDQDLSGVSSSFSPPFSKLLKTLSDELTSPSSIPKNLKSPTVNIGFSNIPSSSASNTAPRSLKSSNLNPPQEGFPISSSSFRATSQTPLSHSFEPGSFPNSFRDSPMLDPLSVTAPILSPEDQTTIRLANEPDDIDAPSITFSPASPYSFGNEFPPTKSTATKTSSNQFSTSVSKNPPFTNNQVTSGFSVTPKVSSQKIPASQKAPQSAQKAPSFKTGTQDNNKHKTRDLISVGGMFEFSNEPDSEFDSLNPDQFEDEIKPSTNRSSLHISTEILRFLELFFSVHSFKQIFFFK